MFLDKTIIADMIGAYQNDYARFVTVLLLLAAAAGTRAGTAVAVGAGAVAVAAAAGAVAAAALAAEAAADGGGTRAAPLLARARDAETGRRRAARTCAGRQVGRPRCLAPGVGAAAAAGAEKITVGEDLLLEVVAIVVTREGIPASVPGTGSGVGLGTKSMAGRSASRIGNAAAGGGTIAGRAILLGTGTGTIEIEVGIRRGRGIGRFRARVREAERT